MASPIEPNGVIDPVLAQNWARNGAGASSYVTSPIPQSYAPPGITFDLSRGYVPVLSLVTFMGLSFALGGVWAGWNQERSMLEKRLNSLEEKVDILLSRKGALPPRAR